jgi:hypothetical protein
VSRAAAASVLTGAIVLVAAVGGASPAEYRTTPTTGSLDLLSSAHATTAQPSVSEAAFDVARTRGGDTEVDTAALASSTCDECVTESTALHVVYAAHLRRARLDNVADAWAQGCTRCASTALSVQVVVLRGRPAAVPNNRAVAFNAACDTCRTSALAFQVVLVSYGATPLREAEMAELRAWFDEQAAALRASVVVPDPPSPTPSASPTPEPTAEPSHDPSPDPSATPTGTPTPTPHAVPSSAPTTLPPPTLERSARATRRDAASALDSLTALLADALDADPVSADVEVSR